MSKFSGYTDSSMMVVEKTILQFIEVFQRELGRDTAPLKITLPERTWKSLWRHMSDKARYGGATVGGREQICFLHAGGKLEIDYIPDPEILEITQKELEEAIRVSPYAVSSPHISEDIWKRLRGRTK